jgi:hypothetical protein
VALAWLVASLVAGGTSERAVAVRLSETVDSVLYRTAHNRSIEGVEKGISKFESRRNEKVHDMAAR